jgi:hypothetical protein
MSEEEKQRITEAAMDAILAGDKEAASNLLRQIPLAPHLAKEIREAGGPLVLPSMAAKGYNMSEVEAKYGPAWLNA